MGFILGLVLGNGCGAVNFMMVGEHLLDLTKLWNSDQNCF